MAKLLDTNSLNGVFHEIKQSIASAFDNLSPEQKEEIRGQQGIQGIPGESAVFDPTTGNISVIEQNAGESITNPMSQKAITDELDKIGKQTGEWTPFLLAKLIKTNCCLGNAKWSWRTSGGSSVEQKQKHCVIPASPGDKFLIKCTSAGTNTSSHYAWLTSSYTGNYENGDSFPLATGETNRVEITIAEGEKLITAPSDAAYLCINVCDYSANDVTWEIYTQATVTNIAKQTQYNTDDLDDVSEWVDHGYDVEDANGSIHSTGLYWNVSDSSKGKVIPFAQYAGKRCRIRTRVSTPRFAFLAAEPTYVANSSISFCNEWEGTILSEYDGYVPSDCKYLYVYSYNSSASPTDRTPYVETRESIVQKGMGVVFTPSEKISLSNLTPKDGSIGAGYFYIKASGIGAGEQKHIAIPVNPGDTYRVRSVDGVAQVIVATSAYASITTFTNHLDIPTAKGWDNRYYGDEVVLTVLSDGAYILLSTVISDGTAVTYEVEKGTATTKQGKELPLDLPVKLRVVQWNIGGFSKGTSSQSTYHEHPEEYAEDLPVWKQIINDMDADILCCCEYNYVMKTGQDGEPDVLARDEIFSPFKHAYIRPKPTTNSYMQTAIFSHLPSDDGTMTTYTHSVSTGRYYEAQRYRINNKDVYVVATHLDYNNGDNGATYRQEQMETLMAYAADKEYVIICGDFNPGAGTDETARQAGAAEFDQWLAAGFKMANHGYLGEFNTGTRTYSVLDNIIVKGFDVSNIKIYDDPNNTSKQVELVQEHQLSDHAAIGCTLTMLD